MTRRADSIPLPVWRYLPGVNERHADDAFDDIKALCPEITDSRNASTNIAWQFGLRLFNEGYYWEAHEILEVVWLRAMPNSRERFLVQAIIHLANGGLKRMLGQAKAAERLAVMAENCRQRAYSASQEPVMGIDGEAIQQNGCNLIAGEGLQPLFILYEL